MMTTYQLISIGLGCIMGTLLKMAQKQGREVVSKQTLLNAAKRTLALIFHSIALEKNKLIYPSLADKAPTNPSTQDLAKELFELLLLLQKKNYVEFLQQDFLANLLELEEALFAYEIDDRSLPQLILTCSSIKVLLEKKI